jgi:hypothetical protein
MRSWRSALRSDVKALALDHILTDCKPLCRRLLLVVPARATQTPSSNGHYPPWRRRSPIAGASSGCPDSVRPSLCPALGMGGRHRWRDV